MLYFISQMLETEHTHFLVNKELHATYPVIIILHGEAGWIFAEDAQSCYCYWNTATPLPFVASMAVFELQEGVE